LNGSQLSALSKAEGEDEDEAERDNLKNNQSSIIKNHLKSLLLLQFNPKDNKTLNSKHKLRLTRA